MLCFLSNLLNKIEQATSRNQYDTNFFKETIQVEKPKNKFSKNTHQISNSFVSFYLKNFFVYILFVGLIFNFVTINNANTLNTHNKRNLTTIFGVSGIDINGTSFLSKLNFSKIYFKKKTSPLNLGITNMNLNKKTSERENSLANKKKSEMDLKVQENNVTDSSLYEDLKDINIKDFHRFITDYEKNNPKLSSSSSLFSFDGTSSVKSSLVNVPIKKTLSNRPNTSSSPYSSYTSPSSPSLSISISQQTRKLISELSIYLSIAICLIGIISNFLSLKVFCSTKVPRSSSRTYLIALSMTDFVFLVVHFIDDTCKQIVEQFKLDIPINLTDQKLSMCKAFALIRSTCRSASPWIIVVFTLERFLVVNYPQHTNVISKPLYAKRLIYLIYIFSILISLYAPFLSSVYYVPTSQMKKTTKKTTTTIANHPFNDYQTLVNNYNMPYSMTTVPTSISYHVKFYNQHHQNRFYKKTCDIISDLRPMYLFFTLFYTILIIVIPLIIVSVFNALLIKSIYSKSNDQWSSAKLLQHEQEMSYKEIKDKQVQIENLKITWTLIIISLTFILLSLPHMIVYFVISSKLVKSSTMQIVHKITELFFLLNHSINFFLYVISRKSFRNVLKDKMRCDCFNFKTYSIGHHLHHNHHGQKYLGKTNANSQPNAANSLSLNVNETTRTCLKDNAGVFDNRDVLVKKENEFEISKMPNKTDQTNSQLKDEAKSDTSSPNNNKSNLKQLDYENDWNELPIKTSSHLKSEASLKLPASSKNATKADAKNSNKKLKKISLDVDSIKMNIANAIGHKK